MTTIELPATGEFWRHHTGFVVEVVCVAKHIRTNQEFVAWKLPADAETHLMPVREFVGTVSVPGGKTEPRFVRVDRPANRWTFGPEQLGVPFGYEDTNPAPPRCVPVAIDGETVAP